MTYCKVLAALLIVMFSLPHSSVFAQEKDRQYRIIVLETMPVKKLLKRQEYFIDYLGRLGYKDGENVEIELLKAEGDFERAERLLRGALAKGKPDLVLTNATLASKTANKVLAGTQIPILFITVGDPVGAGLIEEIGKPTGTNITGIVNKFKRDKVLNIVLEPFEKKSRENPVRIGYIHSTYPSAMGDVSKLMKVAEKRGDVVFIPYEVEYRKVPDELDAMIMDVKEGISKLENKVDFWWEESGPLGETELYMKTLLENSDKPVIFGNRTDSVKGGALIHLAPDSEIIGKEAAHFAVAILNGKNPGDIVPNPPTGFRIAVNISTANEMGIAFSSSIIQLAGEHIYR